MMKGMQFENLLLVQNFDITYQISQENSTHWGHLSFFKKEYVKDVNKRHLSESLTSVQILL